jgi:5-methyltetrahydropteroyltriglutamate--homocysteine methyltransferase
LKRSTDRILVSHAGTLPRPDALNQALATSGLGSEPYAKLLPASVAEVVKKQVAIGIDVVNDGELSKPSFTNYIRDRLGGLEARQFPEGQSPGRRDISGRDRIDFPNYFARGGGGFGAGFGPRGGVAAAAAAATAAAAPVGAGNAGPGNTFVMCTGPVTYIGREAAQADIDNLKAAVQGLDVEAYLPAVAPGTIEHWLWNEYYKDDEELLFAVADALHEEYKAIVDAGFILQIDDPDLPDGWQMFPGMSVADYRKYAEVRVDAINQALKGIPEDRVRLHICWGSGHGPHKNDIDLRDIIDVVLKTKAEQFSIEASNPRHEHEWTVWENVMLPEGAHFMPGVIGHASDLIEHPQLVKERLVRYANLVGRENVIAGTDCGVGSRVGDAEICWAKFEAMVEGARLASKELWGR